MGPARVPRAGIEMPPAAGLACFDVSFNGGHVTRGEFLGESTLGGMAVYSCDQALLSALRAEALRRRGEISRAAQVRR